MEDRATHVVSGLDEHALDLFAEQIVGEDIVLEELAANSALGTWGSAGSFGSACGTAGTASTLSSKS